MWYGWLSGGESQSPGRDPGAGRVFEIPDYATGHCNGVDAMAEKKTALVRKVYTYADDTTGRSAKPGWKVLTFELLSPHRDAEENLVVLDRVEVSRDMFPAEILECAIGHGLSQKIGDDLSGIATKAAKEEPPFVADPERGFVEYAYDRIAAMVDNLKGGVWVEEGEGSTGASNVTILFEAIVHVLKASGKELTESDLAAVREKLKNKDYREGAKARPDVAAQVAAIQLERAKARHDAAKAKAKAEAPADMSELI